MNSDSSATHRLSVLKKDEATNRIRQMYIESSNSRARSSFYKWDNRGKEITNTGTLEYLNIFEF